MADSNPSSAPASNAATDNKQQDGPISTLSFSLPPVAVSSHGWGPSPADSTVTPLLAQQFHSIPFAPFNKSDRLGRISDWSLAKYRNGEGRFANSFGAGTASTTFGFKHEQAEEDEFELVDNKKERKPAYGRKPFRKFQGPGPRAPRGRGGWVQRGGQTGGRGGQGGRAGQQQRTGPGYNNRYGQTQEREIKEPSVFINPEWKEVSELEFSAFNNIGYEGEEGETLTEAGIFEPFNNQLDRVTPKAPINLQRFENRQHFTATTSEDPILQRLIKKKEGNVYATDTILSVLMAASKSVASWDLIVKKDGDNLIFDKRPNSKIDFLSVNENWSEASETDVHSVNHPENLALEATYINHNFSQQILSKQDPVPCQEPNPFLDSIEKGNEPASTCYRYRKWELSEEITLVGRCAISGYTKEPKKDEDGDIISDKSYILAKALNEFDSKQAGAVDWRQKLEQQTGAVLATEMKNNAYKLGRWTAEAILAGIDEIKLGFVSRITPKNSFKHQILMVKRYKPTTFAVSVNVKTRALWGSLRTILEHCQKLENGTYLLVRDPNKNVLRFYAIPTNAFENEQGLSAQIERMKFQEQ